ncbi:hypothetical protein vBYenSP400_67 [Yersinia phage vB_YenS_P400]|nr:hypothetical protein vBYenSP400_67 [Yersinia phage vB_YenS_P400]
MAYTMEITRDDGIVFASPEFTPSVLIQVMDVTANYTQDSAAEYYFQTNIPNGISCLVFHRNLDGAILYFIEQGSSGYWTIHVIRGTAALVHRLRFYVFANSVTNIPDWGIFFYNTSGQIIYHGLCLPLDIKFWDRSAINSPSPTSVPCAVIGGYSHLISGGGIALLHAFTANNSGPTTGVFQQVGSTNDIGFARVCGYIETQKYDQYYKQSLGIT